MSSRDYVYLAFYCDYCGVQDGLAICLFRYFLSYIDTAWNFFVFKHTFGQVWKIADYSLYHCSSASWIFFLIYLVYVQTLAKCSPRHRQATLYLYLIAHAVGACVTQGLAQWICKTTWVLEPTTYCSEWLVWLVAYWEKIGFTRQFLGPSSPLHKEYQLVSAMMLCSWCGYPVY